MREFARNCGTSLIIVDEIHYLQMRNRNDKDVNNHLKELANIVSATLVYAGIDCDGANLFNKGRSEDTKRFSQTRRRFKEYKVTAYTLKNEIQKNRWLSLINSFEAHMCLVKHEPGSLVGLGEYIFYRTGGSVGAVSTLVRQGPSSRPYVAPELLMKSWRSRSVWATASRSLRCALRPSPAPRVSTSPKLKRCCSNATTAGRSTSPASSRPTWPPSARSPCASGPTSPARTDAFFQSLTPEQQTVVQEATEIAEGIHREMTAAQDQNAEEILSEVGMDVTVLSQEQVDAFREAAQPPVLEYLEGEVDQELIDMLFAAINEYRAAQ